MRRCAAMRVGGLTSHPIEGAGRLASSARLAYQPHAQMKHNTKRAPLEDFSVQLNTHYSSSQVYLATLVSLLHDINSQLREPEIHLIWRRSVAGLVQQRSPVRQPLQSLHCAHSAGRHWRRGGRYHQIPISPTMITSSGIVLSPTWKLQQLGGVEFARMFTNTFWIHRRYRTRW